MNNNFRKCTKSACRFFQFLFNSGTRYQIHSPFLYDFIGKVIRPCKRIDEGKNIEAIRKELLKNVNIILKTDFGAASGNDAKKVYPITIKRIAATSLASRRNAARLFRLIRHIHAGNILEIGTSLGITTCYLALANPKAKIITLEGCPESCKIAWSNFDRLGIKNIDLIEGRFEDTLVKALDQLGQVDLVFIDGNHRKDAVLDYFSKCLDYAHNDTVFIIDDIHLTEDMEEAWKKVSRHEKVKVSIDLYFNGWIFFRKESSVQHFRLRYF